MLFLTGFLWYGFLFICLLGVAVGGVFMGKYLRKKKDAKAVSEK